LGKTLIVIKHTCSTSNGVEALGYSDRGQKSIQSFGLRRI